MATIPQLTVEQYNNPIEAERIEYLTYELHKLEADWQELIGKLRDAKAEYGAIPQALADQVGQLGEDMLDQVRDIDEAYLARQEEVYVAQLWEMRTQFGCEMRDFC